LWQKERKTGATEERLTELQPINCLSGYQASNPNPNLIPLAQ